MQITQILFLIGIIGFILYRKNIVLRFISLEISLFSKTFNLLENLLSFRDQISKTKSNLIFDVSFFKV